MQNPRVAPRPSHNLSLTANLRRVIPDHSSYIFSIDLLIIEKQNKIKPDAYIRSVMSELKKQLAYIDQTNWYFQSDTIDFTLTNPFINT